MPPPPIWVCPPPCRSQRRYELPWYPEVVPDPIRQRERFVPLPVRATRRAVQRQDPGIPPGSSYVRARLRTFASPPMSARPDANGDPHGRRQPIRPGAGNPTGPPAHSRGAQPAQSEPRRVLAGPRDEEAAQGLATADRPARRPPRPSGCSRSRRRPPGRRGANAARAGSCSGPCRCGRRRRPASTWRYRVNRWHPRVNPLGRRRLLHARVPLSLPDDRSLPHRRDRRRTQLRDRIKGDRGMDCLRVKLQLWATTRSAKDTGSGFDPGTDTRMAAGPAAVQGRSATGISQPGPSY